ncbi:PQQ repeat-containing protein [Halogeometricum pallidum JCM 14848]|uniref:PQQ repeat-containing protein n=1 Tax=Halogeometricum pallidum JCM 14848 TaxID=1227487 RepID=M0DDQ5_HALPD|nr:PQQ-binding-like beta-propeller repeat protein [Halogeometricum pallidum]ELZ32933.1 PQQ repeat-containing protein [Halogeometricum pallidum JCM 14848]
MPSTTSRRRFLAAVGATVTASLAGCFDSAAELDGDLGDGAPVPDDATTDWPYPGFDPQGTAYNPNPVGPAERPEVRWSVEGEWPSGRIAVVGDTAYVPTADALLALDTASGEERWRVGEREDTDENYGSPRFTSPAVIDGTVYAGTSDRRGLLALDADSGEERWRWNPGGPDADVRAPPVPTYEAEEIAVGNDEGLVALLDPATGEERWRFEVFGAVSRLAHAFTTLVVGTTGGEVYSLYDGRGLWRRKVGGAVESLVADESGDAFTGTFGGGVYRLAGGLHAGRTRWRAADAASIQLAFADGIVVGGDAARATGLRDRTGDRRWEVDGSFGAPPAASGSVGYLAGDDVVAVNLDGGFGLGDARFGATRWRFPVDGYVDSGVTVADDAVFFATKGGKSESGEGAESRIYALE